MYHGGRELTPERSAVTVGVAGVDVFLCSTKCCAQYSQLSCRGLDAARPAGRLLQGLNEDCQTIQAAIGDKVGMTVFNLATAFVGLIIGAWGHAAVVAAAGTALAGLPAPRLPRFFWPMLPSALLEFFLVLSPLSALCALLCMPCPQPPWLPSCAVQPSPRAGT